MTKNFDELNDAFNVSSEIVTTESSEVGITKPEKHERDTGDAFKYFDVAYGAGVCKVSWPNGPKGQLEFEWS